MTLLIQRYSFSLATILWGVLLVYFYSSGRIVNYLAPDFRFWSLVGGLGLCVMGLFTLITARDGMSKEAHDHDGDCGHEEGDCDHDHEASDMNPFIALILMLVPVGLSVFWTVDSYSNEAVVRKGVYDDPPSMSSLFQDLPPYTLDYIEKTKQKTDDGFYQMTLHELYFGSSDDEILGVLDGLSVEIQGRVIEERVNNEKHNRLRMYRLFQNCCAADSRPVPIVLEFDKDLPTYEEGEWMKVAGRVVFEKQGERPQPVIHVTRIESATAPYEEMLQRRN